MKIRPLVAEMFHANGRTDGHEATNNIFTQFCERTYKLGALNVFNCVSNALA
jgi:hypothetical protein